MKNPSFALINNILKKTISNASLHAIDLIQRMISWDPDQRPSAKEALEHGYFLQESGEALVELNGNKNTYFEPYKERTLKKFEQMRSATDI